MLGAWVDGRVASSIGLDDRGLHYGDGLFETIAASAGRPRFLAGHLARLARGCAALSIPMPDEARLRAEVAQAAALAPHVIVKLIVTRGAARARGYAIEGGEAPRRIVIAYAWLEGPDHAAAPARVARAERPVARPPAALAGVKHLNRLEQVLALTEARRRALDEVLLCTDDDRIVGGSMTNLFLVTGGELVTPPAASCLVAGVMRGEVLRAAARLGLAVAERAISVADLSRVEGAWLTNARVGLWPIGAIADRSLAVHAWHSPLQRQVRQAALGVQDA